MLELRLFFNLEIYIFIFINVNVFWREGGKKEVDFVFFMNFCFLYVKGVMDRRVWIFVFWKYMYFVYIYNVFNIIKFFLILYFIFMKMFYFEFV